MKRLRIIARFVAACIVALVFAIACIAMGASDNVVIGLYFASGIGAMAIMGVFDQPESGRKENNNEAAKAQDMRKAA